MSAARAARAREAATRKGSPVVRVIDYNGDGIWSRDALLARYARYARELRVAAPLDLTPYEHATGSTRWVYPVMHKVIDGIEGGDPACVRIGLEFLEEDARFTFGKTLKSNTARALRRATLDDGQRERVRRRVAGMLAAGQVPHEYKEYAKLLRRVGLGGWWPYIEEHADRSNHYVRRWYDYFRRHALPDPVEGRG